MSISFSEELDYREIDDLIAKTIDESLRIYKDVELPCQQQKDSHEPHNEILSTQIGGKAGTFLYEGIEAAGFHISAGSTYIYPTNYPVRQYQASIVKTALFKNTLVSLPTGLGKTFIAAVVMYNFYRWYPNGKIVFMAPTKPLVAQQTKACHHIMNIPQEDTTEMTGMQGADQRKALWQSKRVFFLTPQVMVNDLKVQACPASSVKCIVIDEAHRATKDYAYCQVIKLLSETDAVFRVLGLSATPGNDTNAVQQVIKNLQIAALEMRSEESLDVAPYIHARDIETVIVECSGNIIRVKEDLLQVFEKYAKKLKDLKALSYNISSISKFQVLKACEKFRGNPPRGIPPAMIGSLIADFTVCMSLAHALELLQIYGLRAFYNYLADDVTEKSKTAINRLKKDEHLREMLKRLQGCLYPKPVENIPYTWSHPKLQKLVTALSEHFKKSQDNNVSSKAIIFCQYRVVVTEIVELLTKCKPLIKAMEFIGQSGGKEKGMPQAKQLQIMKDFRDGLINCLVATCIAEEGLDIGEVDLIILMEAHKSPVRLVQRLGRTGRKRKGYCIVLLTKGREEQKFREAMATRKSYVRNIVNAPGVKSSLCQDSPRMIPAQCNPVQQLVHIHASKFESPARPVPKKQVDIRKCFTAQAGSSPFSSDEDLLKAAEELGNSKLVFNAVPEREQLWPKRFSEKISLDELFSKSTTKLSEWNEWNYDEHQTFYLGHTFQTRTLCHILKATNRDIHLPNYHTNTGELEHNFQDKHSIPSPKANKKNKKRKADDKKVVGMDIRICMNSVPDQNIERKNDVIEILSDSSEEMFPVQSVIPEPKRARVESKDECIFIDENCFFEVNNNLCDILSKYMLPKRSLKKTFSFQQSLPDLDSLFVFVTNDFVKSINLKLEPLESFSEPSKSPVVSIPSSPLSSSSFDVDHLFVNENSSPAKRNTPEVYSPEPNQNDHANQMRQEERNSVSGDILKQALDKNRGVNASSDLFNSESIKINNDSFRNHYLYEGDKVIQGGNTTEKTKTLKTLTSSFIEIQNKNFKLFDSFRERREKETQSSSDNDYFKSTSLTQKDNSIVSDNVHKPEQDLDLNVIFSEDEDFECISDNIFNNPPPSTSHSTPVKSPISMDRGSSNKVIGNICSPLTMREFAVPSKMACSTPLVSVKKFKKNVKVDNAFALTETNSELPASNKESEKSSILRSVKKKKKSPSPTELWNLSDLFEEEEEENQAQAIPQDSTMLGITQMVSLIEKEKNVNNCIQDSVENINVIKGNKSKFFEKNSRNSFVDSNVDLFGDDQTRVMNNISLEKRVLPDEDYPFETEGFMLTQKYNSPKPVTDSVPTENFMEDKNGDLPEIDFSELKEDKLTERPVTSKTITTNSLQSDPKVSFSLEGIIPSEQSLSRRDNIPEKNEFIRTFEPNSDFKSIKDLEKEGTLIEVDSDNNEDNDDQYQINVTEVCDENDLLLTQKYNALDLKNTNDLGNKNNTDNFHQKRSIGIEQLQVGKMNAIESHPSNLIQKFNNVETLCSEPASSESMKPQSQSQVLNFKTFNKKKLFIQKSDMSNNRQNKISSNSQLITNNCDLINKVKNTSESEPFSKSILSYSEKIMPSDDAKQVSFSEPKAKISLFKSKPKSYWLADDSDDDVFALPSPHKKKEIKSSSDEVKSIQQLKMSKNVLTEEENKKTINNCQISKKASKRKKVSGLIETEADVSGVHSTDDSDGSSLDDLDRSFINDNTEHFTQAMYLKSVKSPVGRGRFKIPTLKEYPTDVYSQQVEPESEYINDSFCVGSDEESDQRSDLSLSLLDVVENELLQEKKIKAIRKRRRRILNNLSGESSSDDKPSNLRSPSSEPMPVKKVKKRRRLLSSSGSDGSPLTKKR